jgi:RecJ-like exonuclease
VKTCPDCNGDGVIEKGTDDEQQCPTCGGSGFVPDNDDDDEEVTRTASWFRSSMAYKRPISLSSPSGGTPMGAKTAKRAGRIRNPTLLLAS